MATKIEELKVGAFYRGKGKKGQRCANARSPFYGFYLDRKITALRYSNELNDIEVDFEVRSTRGRNQTKTVTVYRFIKWTQGEVNEDMGPVPGDPLQPAFIRRAQGAARDLGLSDDRKRWQLPEASRNKKMGRKTRSTESSTQSIS